MVCTIALQQPCNTMGKVRLKGYHLFKPHASVLVSRPANCIPFLSCDSTMEAATLTFNYFKFLQLLKVQTTGVSNPYRYLHFSI